MKRFSASRWLGLAIAAWVAATQLAGCATPANAPLARLSQVARELPGADPRWQQSDPDAAGVRVWRDGRLIRASRGMALQPGDEVETGPQAAAVIRFRDTGETVLDERTRVRIGSLEVLFGRIFAKVKNLFEASSENVVAGVEGTRFLFEVRPDRSVRVAVADGVVACRSRSNQWAPFRLRPNEAMFSSYPNRSAPRLMPADARELRELEDWSRQVADAPEYGWCCMEGRVVPSWSNRCGGNVFSSVQALAQALCKPAPAPEASGWCCSDGRVSPGPRSQCKGSFFDNRAAAAHACKPVIR